MSPQRPLIIEESIIILGLWLNGCPKEVIAPILQARCHDDKVFTPNTIKNAINVQTTKQENMDRRLVIDPPGTFDQIQAFVNGHDVLTWGGLKQSVPPPYQWYLSE